MNERNIQQLSTEKQETREGIFHMYSRARISLIHSLIREYGENDGESYTVNVREFCLSDKKMILPYFAETLEEYEWACEFPHRIESLFREHEKYIQKAIDDECFEVYRDDMEEKGMVRNWYTDNNEIYWTRR